MEVGGGLRRGAERRNTLLTGMKWVKRSAAHSQKRDYSSWEGRGKKRAGGKIRVNRGGVLIKEGMPLYTLSI